MGVLLAMGGNRRRGQWEGALIHQYILEVFLFFLFFFRTTIRTLGYPLPGIEGQPVETCRVALDDSLMRYLVSDSFVGVVHNPS